MQMTEIQAARAFALAKYFGHEWGTTETNRGVLDVDQIRANTEAAALGPYAGIQYPNMEDCGGFGPVVHTTGTGRTKWEVSVTGVVTVTISRPTATAIVFCIQEDGHIEHLLANHCARIRHARAASDVCRALGVDPQPILDAVPADPTSGELAQMVMRHFDRIDEAALYDLLEPLERERKQSVNTPPVADPAPPSWKVIEEGVDYQSLTEEDLAALPIRGRRAE